jgi:two-component system response regulator YesN
MGSGILSQSLYSMYNELFEPIMFASQHTEGRNINMKYRLLIVDDEQEVREILSEIVDWDSLGFEVVQTLKDGREAIAYLKEHVVEAVLTDIKMTFESGIDIAQYINDQRLPVKVVLLSGYQEFQLAREAIRYNVSDYLLKPTDLDELYRVFQKLKKELDSGTQDEQIWRKHKNLFTSYLLFHSDAASDEIAKQVEQLNAGIRPLRDPCALLEITVAKEDESDVSRVDISNSKLSLAKMMANQFPAWFMLIDDREQTPFYAVLFMTLDDNLNNSRLEILLDRLKHSMQRLNGIMALQIQFRSFNWFDNLTLLLAEYRRRDQGSVSPDQVGMGDERSDDGSKRSVAQQSSGKWAVRHAIVYIDENYMKNLSLDLVASQIHLNPVYFGHLFKNETSKNFSDYLVEVRLKHAKQLLQATPLKIYEICERVGYKDIKYFYKLFKKHVGVTPSEYRERH